MNRPYLNNYNNFTSFCEMGIVSVKNTTSIYLLLSVVGCRAPFYITSLARESSMSIK